MNKIICISFVYTTNVSVCAMEGNVIVNISGMNEGQDYYKSAIEEVLRKNTSITGWRLKSIEKLKIDENHIITNVLGLISGNGTVSFALPQNMLVSEVLKAV